MTAPRISLLVEALNIGQILPEVYAQYRPLLVDGVCYFLALLPENRLTEILAEQYSLAAETRFSDRVLNLLHQCPTLHKLGQIVARDRRLSTELRQSLQNLESICSDTALNKVPADVKQQLMRIPGIEVAGNTLAEASVAVILPFSWQENGSGDIQHGVFKLLKSGIAERLHEELDIWGKLGAFLEERCEYHGLPPLDYRETLESMCRLLRQEICFTREQRHLVEAGDFYADEPDTVIPRLLPFCSDQVTAMERIFGGKVTDAKLFQSRRRRLANRLIDAMIAKPFWDPAGETIYHADPHAGNLFCTDDEKLAILDWTLAGHLSKEQRISLMQIVLGGLFHNEAGICRAVENLGRNRPDESLLRAAVAVAMREIRQGQFPGFAWSQRLLDNIALANIMGFPESLVLFRKALLTLSSVIEDIAEKSSVDRILLNAGVRRFCGEAPARVLAHPHSRAFGTHVSNIDLLTLCGSSPNSAAAYWLGAWQDCLESFRSRSR
ncbi:MAG: hypothetical protein KDI47_03450 [Gammaproteobacteria bacterium]|nr:hypothetical protein [Gammaproteobacteria bacterium]